MLTSLGQVYLKALQVLGAHKRCGDHAPQHGGDPGLHGTGIDPPSIQAASSLSLHRLLTHVGNTLRYDPDRFSLCKAPLLNILLILHEPGWLISAAFIHMTRGDARPYSLLCLQARTSFVWISSKPYIPFCSI